jgi:pilus assembly protein Flp/PilA
MNNLILKMYVKGQTLWSTIKDDERGQDLVEYGLVIVLVCLAATAGMKTLADGINTAMGNISTKLGTYTT